MKPLFCGNFEYETRQSDLERAFSKYGRVERVDMKSGFAFVYFDDERAAADAIRCLNDRPFGYSKRRLSVEWARGDRGSRHREGSKSMANHRPTKTLFVINFDPIQTRITDIERHFEPYGKVLHVRIRRNFAFVQFETQEEATDALEHTHMSKILDRVVSVEYALRDDDERDRRDSPRRGYGGRRDSPYGRSRSPVYRSSRPSPDYGRGRSRPSPDYGRGRSRPSPEYGEVRSPDYGCARSPGYGRPRSPGYSRPRSPGYGRPRSPGYGRPHSPGNGHPLSPDYGRVRSPVGSPGYGRARSPVGSPDYVHARNSVRSPDYGHVRSPVNDCARSLSRSPVNGHARSPSNGRVQSPGNGHACSPDYGRSRSPGYPRNGELSPEFDRERSGSPVRRSRS